MCKPASSLVFWSFILAQNMQEQTCKNPPGQENIIGLSI